MNERLRLATSVLKYGLLLLGSLLMILPFVDMFIGALRAPADVYANPPRYLPAAPQWGSSCGCSTNCRWDDGSSILYW
ncbi:MAG: hypothetical protein FJX25_18035 [Alphaproteobacteria bacterium]|nr:hypothetical protein [Alphaproteobacteria bacterium]